MNKHRVLLLSAYDAQSHRYWRENLANQFPEADWQVLTLPPRYFSWRVRGNSLSWAYEQSEVLNQGYDLLIATSMTDLSALRGFVPKLGNIPTVVYFHENQFAYPIRGEQFNSIEPQVLSLYTALCADHLVFNSEFNRRTFVEGVRTLLNKLPDHTPKQVIEQISNRSQVLPVPLASIEPRSARQLWPEKQRHTVKIVWAARWEYDKGPDTLLGILKELQRIGLDYSVCLLGQRFRNTPKEFDVLLNTYKERIVHAGYAESKENYLAWLHQADIVLSTAKHEFQGLAVLEAVQQGCIPVVPDTQVYPELFEDAFRYRDAEQAAQLIRDIANNHPKPPSVEKLSWPHLYGEYHQLLFGSEQRQIDKGSPLTPG